ncbi:LPP20 family lipoprotein [Helicobacter burdigaliensis]|uniref:LPP20 family lipoprotein n=1 Tax=Helicobacter burdigaliensis TaxID=2315334 RepID=UPI000EF681D6|nr:LPP20 family lipoprotein [Helicobacter burdigaliensis]
MKKIFVFLFLGLLLALSLEARVVTTTNTKSSTGEGSGLTREEAINNAIIEAIGKMSGVSINSLKKSTTLAISDNNGSNIQDTYSEQINKATKGKADSYEINSVDKDNEGKYIANVTIYKTTTTKKYQAPGLKASNRRSITVFNVAHNDLQAGIGNNLQQKIITDLLQSRKFNVLDRDSDGYYQMEKALIQSGDTTSDEVYKLKNVLATDYILLFTLSGAEGSVKTNVVTGKDQAKIELSIEYRVLLFATRQIKYSNTLVEKFTLRSGTLSENEKIIERIAAKISSDVLNAIYPLKVAEISGNEAVFSQTLNVGDTYECFSLGKAIKDSYTKETTGQIETKVGTIEITRSTPKLSYGKITEGSVKKGNLCRPLNIGGGFNGGGERGVNYKEVEGGGVNLGF